MPITLEKLFSPTATVSFPFLDDTVNVTYAPFRYTGEMQELVDAISNKADAGRDEIDALRASAADAEGRADALEAEEGHNAGEVEAIRKVARDANAEIAKLETQITVDERNLIRSMLAALLVKWDVIGENGKPYPTDEASLKRLPVPFLLVTFFKISGENDTDPTNAPNSDDGSSTEKSSAQSLPGTSTSEPLEPSESAHSSSTNGRGGRATTRSGARGR